MTSANGFSDSQESDLVNEEDMKVLEKSIGCIPSYWIQNIIDDKIEENYDLEQQYLEENKPIKDEDEEQYYREIDSTPLPSRIPVKEEFPGRHNFQVSLGNQDSSKHWIYSQILKKVFINMEETLPLRLKWDPPEGGLLLRTAMVFSLDQYAGDPVRRCHNHTAPNNSSNRDVNLRVIKHVVRCTDSTSMYEERNEHLSVVTPLHRPQPGSQYVPVCFKFLCKNSCPSGMNRRPTELIFTLENSEKTVLGRRRLSVRVCSCPKRDKKKEEAEVLKTQSNVKKIKLNVPVGKKMMPSCDTHVFSVQLNVVGKENYLSVLKYAYDIMAGQAARTGQFEFFKPYMDDILRKTP
ncbi:Cellular tumor antigen p53 [Habropoda laboriosa]|uniref:Cellular tumor antigen p53 n=1 Tax=Habropoda laboriosa TaxID=597456 RepID=A0A0L7RJB6_9HYME|nr:PREDICTED: cellular tumor antigen p53 [Habropoda laboriosa]KOC70960.1 Cellular tumor antigen p53 [Habropoda laboriosa]